MAKKLIAALTDSTLFLQEWLANPQRTGSVAPSSPQLAAAMARWLPCRPRKLCPRTRPRHRRRHRRAAQTRPARRPAGRHRAQSHAGPAAAQTFSARPHHHRRRLADGRTAPRPARAGRSVGAVISSLPLLNFPKEQADALAQKIRAILEPRGLGAIQLPHQQGPLPGRRRFSVARLQNCLARICRPPASMFFRNRFPACGLRWMAAARNLELF